MIVVLETLQILTSASIQALKDMVFSLAPQNIVRPFLIIVLILLYKYLFKDILTTIPPLTIYLISTSIVLIILTNISRRKFSLTKFVKPEYRTSEWLKVSLALFLINGFSLILKQSDTVMIGMFLTPMDVGFYHAASRISLLVVLGINSANMYIAPLISELYTQDRMAELQNIITTATKWIFSFTLVAGISIIFIGKPLLAFFGEKFTDGYTSLIILTGGNIINAFSGSVGFLMAMTGFQKISAVVMGATSIINIILNLILIPAMGIKGAAIATSLTTIVWNVVLVYFVNKKLNIKSTIFQKF